MNERLIEIYRSCRPKEALASQDQYQSANILLGAEVAKFAELIVRECIAVYEYDPSIYHEVNIAKILEHFGVEL